MFWVRRRSFGGYRRTYKFFTLGLYHESLENYYLTNFSLIYDHKINAIEWDSIIPYEKQIYVQLLIARLEENNKNNILPDYGD